MKYISIFPITLVSILFLSVLSCNNDIKPESKNMEIQDMVEPNPVFIFPVILDNLLKPTGRFHVKTIEQPDNFILGFGRIGETEIKRGKTSVLTPSDYYYFRRNSDLFSRKGLSILVDTMQVVGNSIYDRGPNPMPYNGYSKEKYLEILPVFIINSTKDTIALAVQDMSVSMIYEALDTDGKWKPIQICLNGVVENSYGDIILYPHNFILVDVMKHDGNFKTKLRLKLKNQNEIYYSQSFNGRIYKSQFKVFPWYLKKSSKDSTYLDEIFLNK